MALGGNDITNAVRAQQRWRGGTEAGLPNYNLADPESLTDPVDFSEVFKIDEEQRVVADFEPLVQVRRLSSGMNPNKMASTLLPSMEKPQ